MAGGGSSRNEVDTRAILAAGPVSERRQQETPERDRIGRVNHPRQCSASWARG